MEHIELDSVEMVQVRDFIGANWDSFVSHVGSEEVANEIYKEIGGED